MKIIIKFNYIESIIDIIFFALNTKKLINYLYILYTQFMNKKKNTSCKSNSINNKSLVSSIKYLSKNQNNNNSLSKNNSSKIFIIY